MKMIIVFFLAFFLRIDDIEDNSNLRRGMPGNQ